MFEPDINLGQTPQPQTQPTPKPAQESILDDNQPDLKTAPKKAKLSPLSVLLIILTLAISAVGIYFQLEINALNQDIEATQTAIEAQAQNIITEDNQEVTLSTKKVFLDLKTSERTFFKNVIQDLNQDIINNSDFRAQSYTITPLGQISLNISSTPLNLNPLNEAARLIENLEQRNYFQNVFIPGITQSLTETGLEQIQFNLQLSHQDSTIADSTDIDTSDENDEETNRPSPILN